MQFLDRPSFGHASRGTADTTAILAPKLSSLPRLIVDVDPAHRTSCGMPDSPATDVLGSDPGKLSQFALTRTQIRALLELTYRGRTNGAVLRRAASTLEGRSIPRGGIPIWLTETQMKILVASARSGRRESGIAAAAAPLQKALDTVRQGLRGPIAKDTNGVSQQNALKRCVGCHKLRQPNEFAGTRGVRCISCRRLRITPVRIVSGGAPTLGHRR